MIVKRRRQKLSYQRTIVVGFLALYVMCMLFSTYFVKENYENTYKKEINHKIQSIFSSISYPSFPKFDKKGKLSENYKNSITLALSAGLEEQDKYHQVNFVLYGPDGEEITQTTEYFGETQISMSDTDNDQITTNGVIVQSPYDYFTEKEIDTLLYYLEEEYKEKAKGDGQRYDYSVRLKYNQQTGEPIGLEISKELIKTETRIDYYGVENTYWETVGEGEVIWTWKNPHIDDTEAVLSDWSFINETNSSIDGQFFFPHIVSGRKYYESWKNNKELHTVGVETTRFKKGRYYLSSNYGQNSKMQSVVIPIQMEENLSVGSLPGSDYALQVNQVTYPWLAAIDYLKYVYFYGLILMAVCMLKTIHVTKKAYEKQEELEQTRRDFLNVMAHALKTPLAIIRGLVENMDKESSEEKNRYYRREAVHQTEVMDDLIKEMIALSMMDAAKMKEKEGEES